MMPFLLFSEGKNISYQAQHFLLMNGRGDDSRGVMRGSSTRENVIRVEKKSSHSTQKKKNILCMIRKSGGATNGLLWIMGKVLIFHVASSHNFEI